MRPQKRAKLNRVRQAQSGFAKQKPRCQYFGECGGCLLQNISYADQLSLKKGLVNKSFAAAGLAANIKKIIPSPGEWYYRNRMDYPVGQDGEIGLKPFGKWREVLDLKECFLLSPQTPEILQLVRDWMRQWNLAGWNNKQYTGYVRYVVLREGKNTGERLVLLVTADGEQPAEVWADLVKRLAPLTTTIYHGVNPTITDISIPQELILLHGAEFFTEKINDNVYTIAPASFFQTNSAGAAELQKLVRELVTGERVLDLYCGLGFFTLDLARQGKTVTGVELDAAAIVQARVNAVQNKVAADFFAAATEDWVKSAGEKFLQEQQPQTIIIDPPRAGLHPRVVEWLVAHPVAQLICVSCNHEQLACELPKLLATYKIASVQAIDMFPHTPHVEVIVSLSQK